MKTVAFLLSLYILVLIALPCIDVPLCNISGEVACSQNTTDNPSSGHEHCSPFCICHFWVSPMTLTNTTLLIKEVPFIQKYLAGYTSAYRYSPFYAIWQPPQLS